MDVIYMQQICAHGFRNAATASVSTRDGHQHTLMAEAMAFFFLFFLNTVIDQCL